MKYMVDIDDTICKTVDKDYPNSTPYRERIEKLNKLYDEGHEIHYWTARGTSSGKDWHAFTIEQLIRWGCKYNNISVGKPSYDVWIDDKAVSLDHFFEVEVK